MTKAKKGLDLKVEIKSFITTFGAALLAELLLTLNTDISESMAKALGISVLRALVKSLITTLPKLSQGQGDNSDEQS